MISCTDGQGIDAEIVLGRDGLVHRAWDAYQIRPQQIEMAQAVCRAMQEGIHLVAEAGTGVGKSFAYLVAAIDQVCRKRGKVLISTYTITLQQQLIKKDIPFLAGVVPHPFSATLALGRSNYLCLRRLSYATRQRKGLFDDSGLELSQVNEWAKDTQSGLLGELPFLPGPAVWESVAGEHGNCRGRKCPHWSRCFYQQAGRRLEDADIIVANHALLFSDLVLKEQSHGILPEYNFIIIDEAHNIEHVAEEHFGINIGSSGVSYLLKRLYNNRTRKGLLAFVHQAEQAKDMVKKCTEASKIFFAQVQAWYEHTKNQSGGRCQADFVQDNITAPLRLLRLELGKNAKKCDDEDEKFEFGRYIDRCLTLETDIKRFLSQAQDCHVYWVETGQDTKGRISLRSAPLNVGPDLKRCLFEKYKSVVATSATLSCRGGREKEGFEFFTDRVGLDDFTALRVGSPFDYEKQVTLYIEADLPDPNEQAFDPAAAEAIKKYILMTKGRAFVLFTSYSMLKNMAERLAEWLSANGMQLYIQGQGVDRTTLLERFRAGQGSVLFGTDSFWQGVDVPGESLSNVIIVRLPFAVPNHPLLQGRIEQLRAEGNNPFFTYQLPTAILKFKQGFGRLIRSSTDTGIVVVLDSRIVQKSYGRLFMEAIPTCRVEIVRAAD